MPAPQYAITTEGAIASGTSAKTVLGAKAHANSGLLLLGFTIGFVGTTTSNPPVLVEIGYCTWATNSPGTNSTSVTVKQRSGRVLTAGFTGGKTWTSEPTTITSNWEMVVTPAGGLLVYDYPLGTEPDSALAEGFVLRVTAANDVNLRATMKLSRC